MTDVELTRGERFKDARIVHNKHGKQQLKDVSKDTGVAESLISDVENDKVNEKSNKRRDPNCAAVVALAKHYGVSTDYLLGLDPYPRTNADIRAASSYTGLSEAAVKALHFINNPPDSMGKETQEFNRKTLLLLNLLLEDEEKKIFFGPFGADDIIFKNVFSEMYDYIFMGKATSIYLGHDDGTIPEYFNRSALLREMHVTEIRRQMDYYVNKIGDKENG